MQMTGAELAAVGAHAGHRLSVIGCRLSVRRAGIGDASAVVGTAHRTRVQQAVSTEK